MRNCRNTALYGVSSLYMTESLNMYGYYKIRDYHLLPIVVEYDVFYVGLLIDPFLSRSHNSVAGN
jgi:hypothetical protein